MMKKQGNHLLINLNYICFSVPLIENQPDFSAFTEPTLSVMQKAWQEFLESGEELENIPDPEIIPDPPVTNWDNFNLQIMSNPRFNEVYNQCLQVAPIVCAALPTALDQVTSKPSLSLFTLIWTQLCSIGGATTEDKIVWGEYAINNNLPQDFINVLTA